MTAESVTIQSQPRKEKEWAGQVTHTVNSLKEIPRGLRKKFRLGEFVAEMVIRGIAFISCAVIILIFVFVFREAAPVFFGKSEKPVESNLTPGAPAEYDFQASAPEEYAPESYGELAEGATRTQAETALEQGRQRTLSLETAGAEGKADWKNLTQKVWQPISREPKYGLVPLLVGTFKVTLLAVLLAAPIAILAALFSNTFAPRWVREVMKPTIEILAGFPSVVIGFFALVTLATFLQKITGAEHRLNAFVGGAAMSLAVIPIIFTVAEDALAAVPKHIKEASLALGASSWQTAWRAMVPAATPGIFAAVLLGIGRAFGETMIALMATGNAALVSWNFLESVRTLSATIGAEMAEVVFGETHYSVLFLIGSLLFVFTFSLNAIAEFYVRQRLLKRFRSAR